MGYDNDTNQKATRSFGRYLSAPIQVDQFVDLELLLLTFSTGIQDAISYPDFRCFASNQTGNSVVLAVGLAGIAPELFDLSNVGISLGMFIVGLNIWPSQMLYDG